MAADIQDEGNNAYLLGEKLSANPHPKGSKGWYLWITGWRLAWEIHEDIVDYDAPAGFGLSYQE